MYHPGKLLIKNVMPINVIKEAFKVAPVLIRKVGFIKPTAINVNND